MNTNRLESGSVSGASIALRNWQFSNNIRNVDMLEAGAEEMYEYDANLQQSIRSAKPWEKDPHYFKEVKVSALALLKMVMHARSGRNLEIMGLLQGKVDANTIIVMDTFALPVEGTETRVNAQAQAYEYMSTYTESCEPVGRLDKVVGWYHSHPGYGCWLSGIDVSTQTLNQQYQEPFVAIVIDPIRTISAGKVDLGAFRTYPKGYKPPEEAPSEYQSIPSDKIDDFGVHCKQYYSLDVSYFKSSLDAKLLDSLWNTYWVSTLSTTPLLNSHAYTTSQITDLSKKLKSIIGNGRLQAERINDGTAAETLNKAIKDSDKVSCEVGHGLITLMMKKMLFNRPLDIQQNAMEM
uniref:MPN domain-containing protein n=1 Tax=Syphacia muris TaxID=451379 RepID=A0A0N5A973_9BILA